MMKLLRTLLLSFLFFLPSLTFRPHTAYAQQYIVKPYIVVPADKDTEEVRGRIPAQRQAVLQALKEVQAWYARTLNGHTFNLDENVQVVFSQNTLGNQLLGEANPIGILFGQNYIRRGLFPEVEEGVVNITWVVGLWEGPAYGEYNSSGGRSGYIAMSYDALFDLQSTPQNRDRSLHATAHELGHAFGLVEAGWAKVHPCTVVSEHECHQDALQPAQLRRTPLPGIEEWNKSLMGYGYRNLGAGLNNSRHNPEIWKAYKSPFLNPQGDPAPEPEPSKEGGPINIDSISPNPARQGERIHILGSGFGSEPGQVGFYSEVQSRQLLARQILRWTDELIDVTVLNAATSGQLAVTNTEGSTALHSITVLPREDRGLLTVNYSTTCGENRERLSNILVTVENPSGGSTGSRSRYESVGTVTTSLTTVGQYLITAEVFGNLRVQTEESHLLEITDIQKSLSHSVSLHYPQCPQAMISTISTPQPGYLDTSSSGSSLATAPETLVQSCNPTQLVTHWGVETGTCEANIVVGSNFYPISDLCEAAWHGTAIQDKDGNPIPIVDGGTYQLAVKRNGQIVATTDRVTVQCGTGGPETKPIPADQIQAGPGQCPNPNLKPEDTPPGYKWEADCNASCTKPEDCGEYAPGQLNWCYGFEGGARCLRLKNTQQTQVGADGPEKVASPTSCIEEVRNEAKSRGAPDARERGLASADEVANDVCGRGTLDLFKKGCDTGVQFGTVPRAECGGVGAPAKKTATSITVNNQPIVLDGSSGISFSLLGTPGQAQVFDIPVIVQYSDGSSKLFHIKFNYLGGQGGRGDGAPPTDSCKTEVRNIAASRNAPEDRLDDIANDVCGRGTLDSFNKGCDSGVIYGTVPGADCGGGGTTGGGADSSGGAPPTSDSCKTEVKSVATSRNAPDNRLDDIANDVCGRGSLDLFRKGCDSGVIYGTVPGADCGGGSSPAATQPVKDTSKEDCGTRGGNHCANKDIPASVPTGCQDLGTTWDCTGGCFKCNK